MTPRGVWTRLRELWSSRTLDRDSADELAQHIEWLVERKMASGLDQSEARRLARLELGDPTIAREDLRAGRASFVVEQSLRDVRFAGRALMHAPGSALLAIVTIALGIGASTALFSLLSGIVLTPLPYPEPDRLVSVYQSNPEAGITRTGLASGNINDWRTRSRTIEGLAGYYTTGRTLAVGGDARVLVTAQVTEDFFQVLGVVPAVGAAFTPDDFQRAQFNSAAAPVGADPVVILSHRLWQQVFGADRSVVGRSVTLERRSFRIVGVMPDGFGTLESDVDLWIPWDVSGDRPRDQRYLSGIARLRSGVTIDEAVADMQKVSQQMAVEHPAANEGWSVALVPLHAAAIGDTASILWLLFGSVGLVLLIACGNVALLAIIRGLDRSDESMVRLALGASRGALVRGFLMQSGLVAVCGGVLGIGLALAAVRLLPSLASDLPRVDEVALDQRALWFAVVVTGLSALLSGLPQAWSGSRVTLASGWRSTGSRSRHRLRDVLVAGQVAVAVVLLAGSGLLVRSYVNLASADSGVDPRGVLVAPVFLDSEAYNSGARAREYYRTLFERIEAIPGVEAVAGATTVPGSPLGPDFERPVWVDGARPGGKSQVSASVRMVTPGFFDALGVPVTAGRAFDDRDRPDSAQVVIVGESLAQRLWPGASAIGRTLVVDYSRAGTYPYEVVGVAADVRFKGPRSVPRPEIYFPHAQRSYLIMHVVIRASGNPRALISDVREAMRAVDAQKPAQGFRTLEELLGSTYARDRQVMATLSIFAATATFLAMLGVYGALSQRVRERSREIGIRIALGADARRVAAWVGASAVRLLTMGLVIGLGAGWILAGTLRTLLFGVGATDAVTAAGVVVLLAVVGGVAALIPAVRAMRIDPVMMLRRP